MQVGSFDNTKFYAQYHSSSNAKKNVGTSIFEGSYSLNESVNYQRSAETVDYQECYKAWMSQGNSRVIEYANGNSMEQTGAVSIAETEDEGEFLGLAMVPEEGQSVTYGMRAMLSEKSTPDNPIVQVISNLGGKKVIYNVEVNNVNPNNATQLEMFALLSYTDKMGITDGGTFGSHQQLEVYGGNASGIGYCGSLSGADAFLNERFDWTFIMEKMVQVYKDAGIENQAEDCKALFDFFATYTENNEVKDNMTIDFSRFAPNAPKEVKQAFMEAAEETGYNEGERMDYLSQVFIHQVENRQNGVADYTDVFGSSVASALQAAREMLYDLENPLMPVSQRGENASKYVEQEKEFYRAVIEKLERLVGTDTVDTEEMVDYAKILEEKINEIFVKIQNGDTEPTYQIGAQSFTEKEWEQFLDKFDSIEEAIQELMKEEQAKKEVEEEQKVGMVFSDASTLLTTESTSCVYETANPDDDDIRYITWYTEEGIFCRKAGQTEGYEWSIIFESKEQYDKVMEFIRQFPSDWNMRFAAHENFWNDFLNDEIDLEGFMEFINGTNKAVPDFSVTEGEPMYVDKEKVQWAKYTNPLEARFYTAEEMHQMQMEIIVANEANLTKMTTSYGEIYKLNHPDYNGERIFCEYPGGPLYTADEIGRLKWEQFLTEMNMTEEEMHQAREEWRTAVGYVEKVDSTESISTESKIDETKSTEINVSNFKEYETPNYQFVPEPDIGTGGMRILKNGQSVAVFSVDDLKIRVDEQTGTRVLISEIGGYNGIWYDAIAVDAELENGLAEAIGVDDIPEVGLEGYYIGTHAGTGIQYVMKPGEEGRGGKVLFRNEADVARYNALAEEYYNRYPNLINSQEEGRIWASFEIVGMAERTDTGIVRIGYDGVSYNDNSDYKKNWSIIFTEATWELLNEWLKDNRERMTEWDKFGSWGDVFDKIGGSYERIWSDEELKQGYLNN